MITTISGKQVRDESIESIDIKNGEIKKEDLNLTDTLMTGATISEPGLTGLVPSPSAGDNNKFLRGDGTWAFVSGESTDTLELQRIISMGGMI